MENYDAGLSEVGPEGDLGTHIVVRMLHSPSSISSWEAVSFSLPFFDTKADGSWIGQAEVPLSLLAC